jgi:hypothetical protein
MAKVDPRFSYGYGHHVSDHGAQNPFVQEDSAMNRNDTRTQTGLEDLVIMARECVTAGTIGDLETPAILRQIARDHLGARIPKAAQADLIPAELLPRIGDLVVAEFEVRPGVRGIWLTKAIHNDGRLVAIGAFERACHRMLVKLVRRLVRLVSTPIVLFPVPRYDERPRPTVRQAGAMALVRHTRARGTA